MRREALLWLVTAALLLPASATAQVMLQATPPPLVTAENETWFLSGEPITWAGDYYFPSGPRVFFNGNHMVRSGSYRGIPLYTDAAIDPYNIVYVPLEGGSMQPYERKRTGRLAGTTGGRAPSFPVDTSSDVALRGVPEATIGQASAPPVRARPYDVAPGEARRIDTLGAPMPSRPLQTVGRPKGINGVWVEYAGSRWFSDGPAQPLDDHFTRAGTYYGYPVYVRSDAPKTIYIPSASGLVAPYSPRPR